MAKTIHIAHFAPIPGLQTVEPVTIEISGIPPIYEDEGWEQEQAAFFVGQAELLAETLCNHLPGGTLDRLLARLLEKKASLFVVPLFRAGKE